MEDSDFEYGYDGTDDNIEILLEDAASDPGQSYIYMRITRGDKSYGLVRDDDGKITADNDEFTILANGTIEDFSVMFVQLFELDEAYLDAIAAAVKAYNDIRNNN